MNNQTRCMSCRFRLMVNSVAFQCAAHFGPDGWAYLWPTAKRERWRLPIDCNHYVRGGPLYIGRELKRDDFCKVAGERIRPSDWARWNKYQEYERQPQPEVSEG